VPHLIPAFENQDDQFAKAFAVLREAIVQRAFPSASVAVTFEGKLIARKTLGHFVYDGELDNPRVSGAPLKASFALSRDVCLSPATLFDLASVTKPVATTTMAAMLYERGILDLEAPISGIIPEFLTEPDPRRREVTVRMLLGHSSGLPAYERLFLKQKSRAELLQAAFITSLTADPGSRAEYSDIGFIVLGVALERLAQETLDRFCQREIFGPLAMANTTFNPPQELRTEIVPTADDRTFRHRVIQGEVQDENAFVLGGVAGHAGLFSTAEDVARFAHAILEEHETDTGVDAHEPPGQLVERRPGILRPETVALFTRRQPTPDGTSRALGWDTPSSPSQSGKYFGPSSFGHLGYTGTSLWIDPDRQLSITLLTNRTWPDCANQAIKHVRPMFHDAIIKALEPE